MDLARRIRDIIRQSYPDFKATIRQKSATGKNYKKRSTELFAIERNPADTNTCEIGHRRAACQLNYETTHRKKSKDNSEEADGDSGSDSEAKEDSEEHDGDSGCSTEECIIGEGIIG